MIGVARCKWIVIQNIDDNGLGISVLGRRLKVSALVGSPIGAADGRTDRTRDFVQRLAG